MGTIFYYPDFSPNDLGLSGFEDVGMDSWYFIQNLGTLFFIIFGYIVGMIFTGLLLFINLSGPL